MKKAGKQRACPIFPISLMVALFFLMNGGRAAADEMVLYRLKWLINMSTVGDVYAHEQGYFSEAGLQVQIKAGGPERDAIRELELGHADFGVASADQVIQAAAKGSPVVVIAQLFQENPLQWIYLKDRLHIDALRDLKGKTIGVTFGKNDEIIMRTLLARSGISDVQVRLYSVRMDYTPFYKGQADLWPVYINTQGVEIGHRLTSAGQSIGFLNPSVHGVHFVANSVVVSERLIRENPDLVDRFLSALIRGWRAAVDPVNSEKAIKSVQRYDQDTPRTLLVEQLTATRRLIEPASGEDIGYIDGPAWEQTERIMLASRQIDRPVGVATRLIRRFIESP